MALQSALITRKSETELLESDDSAERPVKTGKLLIQNLIEGGNKKIKGNGRSSSKIMSQSHHKGAFSGRKDSNPVMQRPRTSSKMNNNIVEIYHL